MSLVRSGKELCQPTALGRPTIEDSGLSKAKAARSLQERSGGTILYDIDRKEQVFWIENTGSMASDADKCRSPSDHDEPER
jgi:hypothetical protein